MTARTRSQLHKIRAPCWRYRPRDRRRSILAWQRSIVNFGSFDRVATAGAQIPTRIVWPLPVKHQCCEWDKNVLARCPAAGPGARKFHTRRHFARLALWLFSLSPIHANVGRIKLRLEFRPRPLLPVRTGCDNIPRTPRRDAAIPVKRPARRWRRRAIRLSGRSAARSTVGGR